MCEHPLLVQHLDGPDVRCGWCGEVTASLEKVREDFGPMTAMLLISFAVRRAKGDVTPAPAFFSITESTPQWPERRKPRRLEWRP